MAALQEQIFAIVEAEQGERAECAAGLIAAEEDGEMGLRLAEFGRHQQAGHDAVAQLRRAVGPHPQVAMVEGIEKLMLAHEERDAPLLGPVPLWQGRALACAGHGLVPPPGRTIKPRQKLTRMPAP